MCGLCSNESDVVPFLFPLTIWDLPQKKEIYRRGDRSLHGHFLRDVHLWRRIDLKSERACKLVSGQACAKRLFYHNNHLIMESHLKQDFSQRGGRWQRVRASLRACVRGSI